jgi:hypothetical protein
MRPTALFALSSGCFAAGVCATPVVLAGVAVGPLSPLALAVLVALAAALGGTTAARTLVSQASARQLQERTRVVGTGFGVVGLYLAGTLAVAFAGSGVRGDVLYPGLGGTALALAGLAGMMDASQSLHTTRRLAASERYVPLPNTKTDRQRRIERWVGGVGLVSLVAVGAYDMATEVSTPVIFYLVGLPGVVQVLVGSGREQAMTEQGLRRGHTIRPWSEFEGYEFSETYLRLPQKGWGTDVRIRLDRIDDEAAVRTLLETVFGRERDERAQPTAA